MNGVELSSITHIARFLIGEPLRSKHWPKSAVTSPLEVLNNDTGEVTKLGGQMASRSSMSARAKAATQPLLRASSGNASPAATISASRAARFLIARPSP